MQFEVEFLLIQQRQVMLYQQWRTGRIAYEQYQEQLSAINNDAETLFKKWNDFNQSQKSEQPRYKWEDISSDFYRTVNEQVKQSKKSNNTRSSSHKPAQQAEPALISDVNMNLRDHVRQAFEDVKMARSHNASPEVIKTLVRRANELQVKYNNQ